MFPKRFHKLYRHCTTVFTGIPRFRCVRNLWACEEALEYAKLRADREKVLKAIRTLGEILDKAKNELEKL